MRSPQNRYEGITFGGAKLQKRVLFLGGMYCDLSLTAGAPPSGLEAMHSKLTCFVTSLVTRLWPCNG